MKPRVLPSKPFPWLPLLLALVVIGAIAAVAWHFYQKRYPSWYEEVRLSDGRIITIHQKRQYFENYGTNQSWVTIDLPELGGKRVWHSYLMPMRVDVVDGKVYVFGAPRGDLQYSYYGDPKYFVVAFEWSGSHFRRMPFPALPNSIVAEENVYRCLPEPIRYLRLGEKDSIWCNPISGGQPSAKSINLPLLQEVSKKFARRGGRIPSSE